MAGESKDALPLPRFNAPVKVLIVVAPYYRDIASELVAGTQGVLEKAGASHDLVEVPGALEVPMAIRIAHRQSNFDGFVALGCVVRGETTHYETVCTEANRGITLLGIEGAAIGNGILTVETMAQAEARAEAKGQNKGGDAAAAALHLIALSRRWSRDGTDVGFLPESYRLAGDPGAPTA